MRSIVFLSTKMTETIASRPPSFSSVTMTQVHIILYFPIDLKHSSTSQVLLPSHSSFVNANCFTGQLLKWMDVCACEFLLLDLSSLPFLVAMDRCFHCHHLIFLHFLLLGMAAERHSGETCVTASVDELHFHDQMDVGEIVVLLARVNCTFKSSMEV